MQVCMQLALCALLFLSAQAFHPACGMRMRTAQLSMTNSIPRGDRSGALQSLKNALRKTVPAAAALIVGSAAANAYGPAEEVSKPKAKPKKAPKQLETDLGIPFVELKKGEGAFPSAGDFVAINYIGFLPDGTIFDETHEKKALSFTYGKKQVIPGLESVIEMMQPGGEVTTIIPSKYAYGTKGVCVAGDECLVPPDTNLKYFIKLKRVGAGYN